MSRHSEGQHNRKLYKIVSKPDGRPNQVGSGEEPSLSNGWQSEQTNSCHQIRATNGTKPAKEIRGGKQKINSLINSKASSCLDQHLTEKSTDRGNSTHEILGHNIERLKHDCCVVNQTDHLIEELEDTREQLKRSLVS